MPSMAGGLRNLRRAFLSLGTHNYRLFFMGQLVSVTGTWMKRVTQDWLILEIGGGPLELSIGIALQSVPFLLFGVWGGVLVDRIANLRKLLLLTQVAMARLALGLGLLPISGHVTLAAVYVAAFGVGCVGVLDIPARQAFVLDMVGRDQAANAISLNSSINNSARLVGPAIAGLVIRLAGTGIAYLAKAATFGAIVVALAMMDARLLHVRSPTVRGRGRVVEGLRYSWHNRAIRTALVATLLVSTFSQNFRVTLPLFAANVFGGGASNYGWLMSALGFGALAGALICAYLATHRCA